MPITPKLDIRATTKLDARTLPTPAPRPDVAKKTSIAWAFHMPRSMPDWVESFLTTVASPSCISICCADSLRATATIPNRAKTGTMIRTVMTILVAVPFVARDRQWA
ncbi:hypothetical protein MPOCJGCO_4832 [Methylobacterium trifolii]|uniref:Uncharacterized protein n=1 Tax=Methylobacterium trifolii TaxID=1003092 RepID=A0ABQ4U5H8_9HYPH|nr:hypothetical protein MPOCJGCO_4832 [Methylobacterium trifolii]